MHYKSILRARRAGITLSRRCADPEHAASSSVPYFELVHSCGVPELHSLSPLKRGVAVVASFALSLQALFFAPYAVPFLYFQF